MEERGASAPEVAQRGVGRAETRATDPGDAPQREPAPEPRPRTVGPEVLLSRDSRPTSEPERRGPDPAILTLGATAAILLGVLLWEVYALGETPISRIRQNPQKFDGKSVTVRGMVGDVYEVGGGYACYLYRGADTIVVFTRTRVPTPRQRLSVTGSVSTGYLQGMPRPALFEKHP